jgi:hypothetical protein
MIISVMYMERLKGELCGSTIMVVMVAIRVRLEKFIREVNRIRRILSWQVEPWEAILFEGRGK